MKLCVHLPILMSSLLLINCTLAIAAQEDTIRFGIYALKTICLALLCCCTKKKGTSSQAPLHNVAKANKQLEGREMLTSGTSSKPPKKDTCKVQQQESLITSNNQKKTTFGPAKATASNAAPHPASKKDDSLIIALLQKAADLEAAKSGRKATVDTDVFPQPMQQAQSASVLRHVAKKAMPTPTSMHTQALALSSQARIRLLQEIADLLNNNPCSYSIETKLIEHIIGFNATKQEMDTIDFDKTTREDGWCIVP